jgi:serine/threonine protein kinase
MISDNFEFIKYIDFGLSRETSNESSWQSTKVGTGRYMAPEIFFQRKFNQKIDLW